MYLSRRTTLGVLLTAGAGSRFTGPDHKLLAPLKGVPVVSYALSSMISAGFEACIAVTGSVALSHLLGDVTEVHNPDWATGQRSSVLAAISYAKSHGFDAIVIGLGDQPFITTDAWQAVANAEPMTACGAIQCSLHQKCGNSSSTQTATQMWERAASFTCTQN